MLHNVYVTFLNKFIVNYSVDDFFLVFSISLIKFKVIFGI